MKPKCSQRATWQARVKTPRAAIAQAPPGWLCLRTMSLIARWLLLASALLLLAQLVPGMQITGFGAALWAAFVLGLLNTLVRPVLVLLTLPVTLLTLGLFLFVINALMFWAAAWMLEGLEVTGFGTALLGSLLYSLMGLIIDSAVERIFNRAEPLP